MGGAPTHAAVAPSACKKHIASNNNVCSDYVLGSCRAAGDADDPLDQLEVALDGMHCMQSPFYYRYNILSAVERRVGGQGLVQFASMSNTQEKVCFWGA